MMQKGARPQELGPSDVVRCHRLNLTDPWRWLDIRNATLQKKIIEALAALCQAKTQCYVSFEVRSTELLQQFLVLAQQAFTQVFIFAAIGRSNDALWRYTRKLTSVLHAWQDSMLEPTKKVLPNWALAGLLGGFVVGTYIYSIRAVGDDSAQVLFSLLHLWYLCLIPSTSIYSCDYSRSVG